MNTEVTVQANRSGWIGGLLMLLLTLLVLAVGAVGAQAQVQGGITVTRTIHASDDLLQGTEVEIMRLTSDPVTDDGALTVTWRLGGSGWFPAWYVFIESATGLIPHAGVIQLGPITIVPDATYQLHLSYDYGSGTLAFVMNKAGESKRREQRIWTIQQAAGELYAIEEDALAVTVGYHPVAAVWDVVMKDENDAVLPVRLLDRSRQMMVRATMGAVEDGELRLVVRGDGEPMSVVLGKAARDETLYEVDVQDFPVGPVTATLEYWVGDKRVWAGEPRELTVGRVDGSVVRAETNAVSQTLDVTVRLEADGPVDGAHVYVDATAKALVWDYTSRSFVESVRSTHRFDLTAMCLDADGHGHIRIPIDEGAELWRVELSLATDPELLTQFPTSTATFGTWSSDVIVSEGIPRSIEASPLEPYRDWEEAMVGIEQRYQGFDASQGSIVFAGSSSIRIWRTLEEDFPGLPVVNAGFGGSRIAETTYYIDRLIFPFNPHTIVFYAGSNDISGGYNPERVLADYVDLVKTVHAKLPDTRMIFISIAPSPGRWVQHPRVEQANRLIKMYSETDDRLDFIDVYSLMLGEDGLPVPHLYLDDGVHMNENGYVIWTAAVRPYLGLE